MCQYSKHNHGSNLRVTQWQTTSQIRVNPQPTAVCSALHLIINANTACDFIFRKIEERHFQTAAQIANARSSAQVRIRRTEPHLGYEVINLGVGHLFVGRFTVARGEIVVTNIRAAADAKHAEEERRENNLHSQEQQHESHVPPAIAKAAQMWRTPTLVSPQCDRNLRLLSAQLRCLDHKFRSELHAAAAHIHPVEYLTRKSAHAAM